MLSKYFYIEMDIIRKILQDNGFWDLSCSNEVKKRQGEFWNNIGLIRNNLIIHRDRESFYRQKWSTASTDPRKIFSKKITCVDNKGKKIQKELQPLVDLEICHSNLVEIEGVLNQGTAEIS